MDQDRRHLSFGQYLRAVRLEMGIDLDTVARATRIMPDILGHIEAEAHDRLPAEVFVKGFLRAYARQIGVDPEDVVARYRATRGLEPNNEAPLALTPAVPATPFWRRLLLALVGLAVIAAASVAVMLPERPAPPAEGNAAPASNKKASLSTPRAVQSSPVPEPAPAKGHVMVVEALAPTWIKIIVDGGSVKTYDLQAGDQLEVAATSDFRLLLGDAAGARLTLDGKPLAAAGESGQVVSLILP